MLSGCVPVIFERTAALTQWPLHWRVPREKALTLRQFAHSPAFASGEEPRDPQLSNEYENTQETTVNVASDCVLYVPRDVAMRNMTDTFAYLARLSRDSAFMATKLRCIAMVGHQMQYKLPRGTGNGDVVKTPKDGVSGTEKDAVDIFLEHLLRRT